MMAAEDFCACVVGGCHPPCWQNDHYASPLLTCPPSPPFPSVRDMSRGPAPDKSQVKIVRENKCTQEMLRTSYQRVREVLSVGVKTSYHTRKAKLLLHETG